MKFKTSMPTIIKKKARSISGLVTEITIEDTLFVDGPASIRILQINHNGHKNRSLINIVADDGVRIWKNRGPDDGRYETNTKTKKEKLPEKI